MNFDDAAASIVSALVNASRFEAVTITTDGSVTVPAHHDAAVAPEHRAGVERIAAGLRMTASRLRPAGEPVSITRQELAMWFEGRDGLEDATPRCAECLVPLEMHPTADAWVCPSCGAMRLA